MANTQFFINPSFKYGQVDDQFIFRTDNEGVFTNAARQVLNFDILASGALRRRGKTIARATVTSTVSTNKVRLIYYPRQVFFGLVLEQYILALTSGPGVTRCNWYRVDNGTSGQFTIFNEEADLDALRFTQIKNTLFFAGGLSFGVYRLDDVGTAAKLVPFWFELKGLYDGQRGGTALQATSGIYTRADEDVGINCGAGVQAQVLIYVPGLSHDASSPWRPVNKATTTNATTINLASGSLPVGFRGAQILGRYTDPSNVPNDYLLARAIAFTRGRLIMGGIGDAKQTGITPFIAAQDYSIFEPSRILMSRVGVPFCVRPQTANDDSPLDFNIISSGIGQIEWIIATETAIYFGARTGIAVIPSNVTLSTLDVRTIDSLSVGIQQPKIWRNGILYVSDSGDKIQWLQFNFATGGQRIATLNLLQPVIISNISSVNIAEPGGEAYNVRRIFCCNNTKDVAVAYDDNSDIIGWAKYRFPYDIKDVVSVGNRVFLAATRGSNQIDFLELVNDDDYVGDYEHAPTYMGSLGRWRAASYAASSFVGVTGVIGGVRRVFLGLFQTEADGDIFTLNHESPNSPVKVYPQFSEYSSLRVSIPFESKLVPLPAAGTDAKGLSLSRLHRVVSIRPFVVNTRQLEIDGDIVFNTYDPITAGNIDLPKQTGWGEVGALGHDSLRDIEIKGYALYQATIAGLSREVAV